MGKSPRRGNSAHNEPPSPEEKLGHDDSPRRRARTGSSSTERRHLSSIQLSESLDEESAALEAEFSHLPPPEEEDWGDLGALDPELDEALPEASVAKKPPAYDDNHTRVAVLAKLAIIEGPDAKKDVPFVGIRMSLGRAPNLEISLTDAAVSRRHAEFVRGDGGVLLRDLGSGNGTLVNGQKVTEKILAHNDLITVGATKLRYINEAETHVKPEPTAVQPLPTKKTSTKPPAPKSDAHPPLPEELDANVQEQDSTGVNVSVKALVRKAPSSSPLKREPGQRAVVRKTKKSGQAPSPKRKQQLLIAASAGVVLCLLLVVFLGGGKKPPPPPGPTLQGPSAETYMNQARDAVRHGRYEEALAFRTRAVTIDPKSDPSNLGAQIEHELEVQKKLKEVEALVAKKQFGQARTALDAVPEASARSNDEKKRLAELMVKTEQQSFLERTEELLMLGDFDAALDALRLVPRLQQTALGEKIEAGRASYNEALRQGRMSAADREKLARAEAAAARKRQIAAAFSEVQRRFNGEDWKRAADECDRVLVQHPKDVEIRKRAQELKKQIPEFGRAYDEGAQKYRAGQIAASAVPLAKARALYKTIDLPAAAIDNSLKEMSSQAALLAGEVAFARGDYAAAATHFSEALKLQPSSERAQRGMARVVSKAEDLFTRGYSLRASDPREARRYFEIIIQITPPDTNWHERAKNQLNSISLP